MNGLTTIDNRQPASARSCYQLDPIGDTRWGEFVRKHAKASVFHTIGWLEALRLTYGYKPVVFTTSPPDRELENGMVFCRIDSWLTGRRLVSLPFSDYCEPLCDLGEDLKTLVRHLQFFVGQQRCKYFEIRSVEDELSETRNWPGCVQDANFYLHRLDLRRDLDEIFRGLNRDSVQRRIQRAERARLVEKCGRSEELVRDFYALFVVTRRRHQLPPTPFGWFRNLVQCQGQALEIRVAYKDGIPLAAILTLRFKDVAYFKYGCSDERFKKFAATPWLLWKAITDAKSKDADEFDMGRTQKDNLGLLSFKKHWVAQPKHLIYWKFPYASSLSSANDWKTRIARGVFSYTPTGILKVIGKGIYRHIG